MILIYSVIAEAANSLCLSKWPAISSAVFRPTNGVNSETPAREMR